MLKFLNFAENFDALHPNGADPLHTNSIDRPCIQPYHNPMRKSWIFLSWLVEQLEFENSNLFFCHFKERSPVPKTLQIVCLDSIPVTISGYVGSFILTLLWSRKF